MSARHRVASCDGVKLAGLFKRRIIHSILNSTALPPFISRTVRITQLQHSTPGYTDDHTATTGLPGLLRQPHAASAPQLHRDVIHHAPTGEMLYSRPCTVA